MTNTTNLNIRTDKEIKKQAEVICSELGINMTSAVNMFLWAIIRKRGIPFELQLEKENETTLKAIEEGRKIAKDDNVKGYTDMKELREVLEVWNMR